MSVVLFCVNIEKTRSVSQNRGVEGLSKNTSLAHLTKLKALKNGGGQVLHAFKSARVCVKVEVNAAQKEQIEVKCKRTPSSNIKQRINQNRLPLLHETLNHEEETTEKL